MSPRCLLAVIALFVGGWRSRGRGGGESSLSAPSRKHVVSTAQARGAALGGGGLAVWLPPSPFPSCGCIPGGPPVGACTARAPCWHGRVVRPALSLLCLPTLPRHPRGGGPLPSTVVPYVPSTSPRCPRSFPWWVWVLGVGWGGAPSLPFLRRKHVAGTALARGTALVLLLGSGARRVAPVFALPTLRSLPRCPPRRGLHACFPWARSCGPSRTLSPPSPLLAALSSGGGAAVRPSLLASPTLGGAEARGGGGGPSHFPFVALMSQARGAASLCRGGGGRLVAPVVALSTLRPPSRWSPRRGLHGACPLRARSCGSSRHRCPPALPRCPRGGGRLSPPLYPLSPPSEGRGWVGGGRCALFVSPPLHARRRQDVGTTQSRGEALGCCGGGGGSVWAFPPCSKV